MGIPHCGHNDWVSWASLARGPIAADLGILKTADMDGRVLVELQLETGLR
jgi:hypothetical protein